MKNKLWIFVIFMTIVLCFTALSLTGCDSNSTNSSETNTVATPTASPKGGLFDTFQFVTLSTTTDGAEIYYTIDGTTPTPTNASFFYSGTIGIGMTTTIKAIAIKNGMNNSGILTEVYTIDYDKTFYSIEEFGTWLYAQPENSKYHPYNVKLNVNYLGGSAENLESIGAVLLRNANKYVFLNLSGNTLTSISANAFYYHDKYNDEDRSCVTLTGITIPDSVTSIGQQAFYGCTELISVTLPDSVVYIGVGAFQGCTFLTNINIPNNITTIESFAFSACSNITSITIPDSVTYIGYGAFSSCQGISSVTLGNGINQITHEAFSNCFSITNITIPDSVTSIGERAFKNCSGLTNITIPKNVTEIGSSAFENCFGITNIKIENGITNIGFRVFSSCNFLSSVTIPDSVTSIESYAFYSCMRLTSVIIGSGVTIIKGMAFESCPLTSVRFESTITSDNFDTDAFGGYGDLREKYLADGGGIGTYTRQETSINPNTWSKTSD